MAQRYTYQQFAEAIRATTPDLAHITDDGQLTHAVLATHPEYQDHVIDPLEGADLATAPPTRRGSAVPAPIGPVQFPLGPPPKPPAPHADFTPFKEGIRPVAPEEDMTPVWPALNTAISWAAGSPVTGAIKAATGLKTAAESSGYYSGRPTDLTKTIGGVHEAIGGIMEAMTLLIPEAIIANPVPVTAGLVAGIGTGAAVEPALEHLGAPPEWAGLGSDIAALGVGGIAGHLAGAPARRRAGMAMEDAQSLANAEKYHGEEQSRAAAQTQMRTEIGDEQSLVAAEQHAAMRKEMQAASVAFNSAAARARVSAVAGMQKNRPGSAFDYMTQLQALGQPPVQVPAFDTIESFRNTPPVLEAPPAPLALPPARTTMIGRTGYGGPDPTQQIEQVGPPEAGAPAYAESAPPIAPDDLVHLLGEQLSSQLEYQPTGQPHPAESTRVKFKERAPFVAARKTVLDRMVGEMEDMPHQRGRLVEDRTTGETYYSPPVAGSDVYWNVVGESTKNPPKRHTITEVIRAYRDTGAATSSALPEGYRARDLGDRAFRNAYDEWVDRVKKVTDSKTHRIVSHDKVWDQHLEDIGYGRQSTPESVPAVESSTSPQGSQPAPNPGDRGSAPHGEDIAGSPPPAVPEDLLPDWVTDQADVDPHAQGGWEPSESGAPPAVEGSAAARDVTAKGEATRPSYGQGGVYPDPMIPSELRDPVEPDHPVVRVGEAGPPVETGDIAIPTPLIDAIEQRGVPQETVTRWLEQIAKRVRVGKELNPEQVSSMIEDLGVTEGDVEGIHEWVAGKVEPTLPGVHPIGDAPPVADLPQQSLQLTSPEGPAPKQGTLLGEPPPAAPLTQNERNQIYNDGADAALKDGRAKGLRGDALAKYMTEGGQAAVNAAMAKAGQPPRPKATTKAEAQQSLLDNPEDVTHLQGGLLTVGPGDVAGLKRWLTKNAAEFGEQDWYQQAVNLLESGDHKGAWRISAFASARYAAGVMTNQGKLKEQEAPPMGEPVRTMTGKEMLAAQSKRKAGIEKEIGRALPDSVDVSPEGILTFDFGGAKHGAVPGVVARATDLTMGRVFLDQLTVAADPGKIILFEGMNDDPNLRINAQIADQIVRDMRDDHPDLLDDVLDLTGIKDDVELGRQYRRAFSDAGRRLNILSQWARENRDEFYHYETVDEDGNPNELGSVGALQAHGVLSPDGFVKWLGGKATDAELKQLEFAMPKGVPLRKADGSLTPEAKVYGRNWFRRQARLAETQKTIDALAPSGSALDRAIITTTIAPDTKAGQTGTAAQIMGLSKALLISKPSTMIRNTWSQALRYVSGAVDDAVAGSFSVLTGDFDQANLYFTEAKNLAKGAARQGTDATALFKHPWADGLEAIYDYTGDQIAGKSADDARKTLSLMHDYPAWETKFLGSLSLEGNRAAAGTSKFALINKITTPEVRNTITVLNRVQEHFFRATVFDSVFRTQLELAGLDPSVELAGDPRNLIAKLGTEQVDRMIGASVSAALDYTFAANPYPGTVPAVILDVFSRNPIVAPLLQLGFPFPRFNFVSAPRWLWDHFPLMPIPDLMLYGLSAFREDASPMMRGRYYMMKEAQGQGTVLTKLDTEIGGTEYDAAKHLQDYMKAKEDSKAAAKSWKAIEKRAEKEGMLPEIYQEMTTVGADLHARIAASEKAKTDWRVAEDRIRNLKGQRDKARKTYSGLQEAGVARSPQEYYARVATGGMMFAAGYMIRSSKSAEDTKWYEYHLHVPDLPGMPGHDAILDLRAYAPQVQGLFLADIAHDIEKHTDWSELPQALKDSKGAAGGHFWSTYMQTHYTGKYTGSEAFKDALEAYLSVSPAAGSTKTLVDTMTGRSAQGQSFSLASIQDMLISTLGQFMGRFTTPLGAINDITGQFDPEEAKARIPEEGTPENPSILKSLGEPALANIPYAREAIPEKTSPMTGQPIQTLDPIARGYAGITQRTQNRIESEVKRTGLPYGAAVPRVTGDREFDNQVAKAYATLLNDNFDQVLNDSQYQSLTLDLRRDLLDGIFKRFKKAAYAAVATDLSADDAQAHLMSPARKQKLARWQRYLDTLQKEAGPGVQPEPPDSGSSELGPPPGVPGGQGDQGDRLLGSPPPHA